MIDAPQARPLRPLAAALQLSLRALDRAGLCDEAAAAALEEEAGRSVSASLVAQYRAGACHLPVDVEWLLARFQGCTERVYGPRLRALGFDLVLRAQATVPLREAMRRLVGGSGRVLTAIAEAQDPTSPGGEQLTLDELVAVRADLEQLRHDADEALAIVVGQLDAVAGAKNRRRTA